MIKKKEYLSIKDFAEAREVCKSTVYNWIAAGYIDSVKIEGSIVIDSEYLSAKIPVKAGRPLASVHAKLI